MPAHPGRADYIHRLAELLESENGAGDYPHGKVNALDIGVGANAIYPIIGIHEYGWHYTGSDIDPKSVQSAQRIAKSIRCWLANSLLNGKTIRNPSFVV